MSDELLTSLLRDVSRSFYLTMRVLPGAVRRQVAIAYLLARTTDTVADTELIPVESRLEALSALRRRILGESHEPLPFSQWNVNPGTEAEKVLLARCEESLRLLESVEDADLRRIRDVLKTIISGQELDLKRFAGATAQQIIALGTPAELDDYTYRVAGCVGEFWTKICRAHLFPQAPVDDELLLSNGIRFGKGLQLVNILRDIPQDLRNGRCYVPRQSLASANLSPESLLKPENEAAFRPIYNHFLSIAEEHLTAGWQYTQMLPRGQFRLRLGCAWPLLIGARTLRLLRKENMLDPSRRLKVSRQDVRVLRLRSVLLYPWPSAWNEQFRKAL
ncbi:MAG TPA: phytoene/squalene synthase family protein [Verrucomicrobiae bacterium]